jgi:hypothetical protein
MGDGMDAIKQKETLAGDRIPAILPKWAEKSRTQIKLQTLEISLESAGPIQLGNLSVYWLPFPSRPWPYTHTHTDYLHVCDVSPKWDQKLVNAGWTCKYVLLIS